MITKPLALFYAACLSLGFASLAPGASGGKTLTVPDLTKGDAIPANAKKDWNLGPTGARGWMYCDKLVTTDARLRALLQHNDLWLRVKAADALAAIGKPALPVLPDILDRIARTPDEDDPRAMEQRYLCGAVFEKMLRAARNLEGVDRDKLRTAILRGLQNQDGHARGKVSSVYARLSFDEIKPLLPAIHEAIVKPAPSGEMFADGVRLAGLRVLARHHVEEGIVATADYVTGQNPWASQERIKEILPILLQYGAHAKSVIPKLRAAADYFEQHEPDFPKKLRLQKAAAVRETIAKIEATTDEPELVRMK